MFDWFNALFSPNPHPDITQSLIVVLIAISVGFFVGKIRIGSISLGVAAIMFVGLFLGHYGFRMDENILVFVRDIGLILFVYGIGIQVGPSFFILAFLAFLKISLSPLRLLYFDQHFFLSQELELHLV